MNKFLKLLVLTLTVCGLSFAQTHVGKPNVPCTPGATLMDGGSQGMWVCNASGNDWVYNPISTLLYTLINQPNGVAGLDVNGKLSSSVIPAGVGGGSGNASFSTVASLPSASSNAGTTYWVTDGANSSDCSTGLGNFVVACKAVSGSWTPQSLGTASGFNTIRSTSGAPSSGFGNNGDFAIDTTAKMFYGPKASGAWPAGFSMVGPQGSSGAQGLQGPAGATGTTGATGAAGAAATIAIGTVTTGAAGSSATVTNSGSSSAATFNFTIPQGVAGSGSVASTTSILKGNGSGGAVAATPNTDYQTPLTFTGNTTKVATSTGTLTANDCAKFDASGNVVDAGAACGSGGGGATTPNTTAVLKGAGAANTTAAATAATNSATGDYTPGTYTASGTGAVARSPLAKFAESISVKDFGAVGDGTTDDTANIQKAINAALTAGGVLTFPAGTYIVAPTTTTAALTLGSNLRLQGGPGVTIKVKNAISGGYTGIIRCVGCSNVIIDGLTIDSNIANNPIVNTTEINTYPRQELQLWNCTNCVVSNNHFQNSSSVNAISINPGSGVIVEKNIFTGYGDDPNHVVHDASVIYVAGNNSPLSQQSVISNNIISASSYGASVIGATTGIETHIADVTVTGNSVWGFGHGMNITGVDAQDDSAIAVSANTIDASLMGIEIWSQTSGAHTTGYGVNGLTVSSNSIRVRQTGYTGFTGGIFLAPMTLPVRNLSIVNNNVVFDKETVSRSATFDSVGIGSVQTSAIGMQNVSVRNNIIDYAPVRGISFANVTLQGLSITGNRISDAGQSLDVSTAVAYKVPLFLYSTSAALDVEVADNTISDDFATSRLVNAFYSNFPTGSKNFRYLDNEVFLSDATHTSWTGYYSVDSVSYPYIRMNSSYAWTTTYAFGAGSSVFDKTTSTTYRLASNGATWVTSVGGLAGSGNGTKVATTTGTLTTNDCVKLDANGNFVDAGATCGTGGTSLPSTTALLKGNGSGGAVAAVANTDYQTPIVANTYDAYGAATTAQTASLQKSSNLSDLANAGTARSNLGLGNSATLPISGNGSKVASTTGTLTTNDCVKIDANGNLVDAGAACGTGGVGSILSSQLADFAPPASVSGTSVTFGSSTPTSVYQNGTKYTFSNAATVSTSGSLADIVWYYLLNGQRTLGKNSANPYTLTNFENTTVQTSITAPPAGSFPLYHCVYSGTAFTSCTSDIPWLGMTAIQPTGRGIKVATGSSGVTINAALKVQSNAGTTYSVVDSDGGSILNFTNTAAVAVALPQAGVADGSSFAPGWDVIIVNPSGSGASNVTVTANTSKFYGAGYQNTASITIGDGQAYRIVSDGTNYEVLQYFSTTAGAGISALTGDISASGTGSVVATLATVNSSPGSCGDATHVCQVTTNGKGLVTAQTAVTITGGSGVTVPLSLSGAIANTTSGGIVNITNTNTAYNSDIWFYGGKTYKMGSIGSTAATGANNFFIWDQTDSQSVASYAPSTNTWSFANGENVNVTGNLTVTGTCTGCGSGGSSGSMRRVTASDTATSTDVALVCSAASASVVETLPASPAAYQTISFKRVDSTGGRTCSLAANTGQNIEGQATLLVPTGTAYQLRWESATSTWWLY